MRCIRDGLCEPLHFIIDIAALNAHHLHMHVFTTMFTDVRSWSKKCMGLLVFENIGQTCSIKIQLHMINSVNLK